MNRPQFQPFKKIKQFRQVRESVEFLSGNDPLPTIAFHGTVKLHGTNAGITLSEQGEIIPQKRSSFIAGGHMGFADFVFGNQEAIKDMLKEPCTVYGEWCGIGIQKGVAISRLSKRFIIFAKKIDGEYVDCSGIKNEAIGIYNICDFENYFIEIDFNNPRPSLEKIQEWVEKVENECPVAKYFGESGLGEGIVWTGRWDNELFFFKTKGEKHRIASCKQKKLIQETPELLASINEFVNYAVTENRLRQGLENIDSFSVINTGQFLKWVYNDIIAEEYDVLQANGLDGKLVSRHINARAKEWFFNELDKA